MLTKMITNLCWYQELVDYINLRDKLEKYLNYLCFICIPSIPDDFMRNSCSLKRRWLNKQFIFTLAFWRIHMFCFIFAKATTKFFENPLNKIQTKQFRFNFFLYIYFLCFSIIIYICFFYFLKQR